LLITFNVLFLYLPCLFGEYLQAKVAWSYLPRIIRSYLLVLYLPCFCLLSIWPSLFLTWGCSNPVIGDMFSDAILSALILTFTASWYYTFWHVLKTKEGGESQVYIFFVKLSVLVTENLFFEVCCSFWMTLHAPFHFDKYIQLLRILTWIKQTLWTLFHRYSSKSSLACSK
jgi:hypothetical protein